MYTITKKPFSSLIGKEVDITYTTFTNPASSRWRFHLGALDPSAARLRSTLVAKSGDSSWAEGRDLKARTHALTHWHPPSVWAGSVGQRRLAPLQG